MSNWPQYTYLALMVLGLGVGLGKHGDERSPHNVWTDLIAGAISFGLLYAGGFFKALG